MTEADKDMSRKPEVDPRVLLAAERTLLAWIRTGLAMMGFGFVVARFGLFLRELAAAKGAAETVRHVGASHWIGTGLVLLGVAVNVTAAARHVRYVRRYVNGEVPIPSDVSPGTVLAVVLGAAGIGMALYLVLAR